MPIKYVKIYHGPYEAFYTTSHKPLKVRALRDILQKSGYRVDFVPVPYINYLVIEMGGFEIFRCNIKNLCSTANAHTDPVCLRAVQAVEESSTQLQRASTYFWLWALIDSQMFLRGPNFSTDSWPFDILLTPLKVVTIPDESAPVKQISGGKVTKVKKKGVKMA